MESLGRCGSWLVLCLLVVCTASVPVEQLPMFGPRPAVLKQHTITNIGGSSLKSYQSTKAGKDVFRFNMTVSAAHLVDLCLRWLPLKATLILNFSLTALI